MDRDINIGLVSQHSIGGLKRTHTLVNKSRCCGLLTEAGRHLALDLESRSYPIKLLKQNKT